MNFLNLVEEELEKPNSLPAFKKDQKYFQYTVFWMNKSLYDQFWPEDIDIAEKFLNERFPEIHQIFRLKYQEEVKANSLDIFDERTIEKLFELFIIIRDELTILTQEMTSQSISGFSFYKTSRCYKKLS